MADEKSTKPREMVHKSQALCAEWLHQLRRARQGMPDSPDPERAERELHDAVMLYWEQIKRFRNREHIETEWYEEPVFDELALDELAAKRLTTQERAVTRTDPMTNSEETVTVEEPWQLTPVQARQVFDQLDACAHKLGFDAEPVEIRKTFGYEEVDAEEVAQSEFGPQPVEIPEGGDD